MGKPPENLNEVLKISLVINVRRDAPKSRVIDKNKRTVKYRRKEEKGETPEHNEDNNNNYNND